jgi:hypothetical protein
LLRWPGHLHGQAKPSCAARLKRCWHRGTRPARTFNRVGIELVQIDLNLEDELAVLGLDFQCK